MSNTKSKKSKAVAENYTNKSVGRAHAESDALFFSIGEGAITTDGKGHIARINNVALEILGYSAEEVVGKWYPEIIIAEDESGRVISNLERPITEAFLSGKPVFQKLYYRKKDNSRVPVAMTVSPLILDGEPQGAIEVFRDITKEVELENTKDEFISIASHQLRTPATVVKQYMGMLLEGYVGELTEEQTNMLRKAYDYNNNQLHIINDLLKIAQVDSNKIAPIRKNTDLVALLKEAVVSQQADYDEQQIKLLLKFNHPTIFCSIDPLHIRMVVENLLSNANKYSPGNTTVTVTLDESPDYQVIEIVDQGIGIAPSDISKLFQKFSRINNPKSTASGNGLGLYWAKKLIDLHNGTINVNSRLGRGTKFTIKLPNEKKV